MTHQYLFTNMLPRFMVRQHRCTLRWARLLGTNTMITSPRDEALAAELMRLASFPAPHVLKENELPTNSSSQRLVKIRHTAAHVLAMAVQKLYPSAKVANGPWTENGFFYDFAIPDIKLNPSHLKKIRKEMDNIIQRNLPVQRSELSFNDAHCELTLQEEPYKLEILAGLEQGVPITMYRMGSWSDLCAGPHLEATGELSEAAIELDFVAGVYWKGDESNQPMLQRIYGTAWENVDQLVQYRHLQLEAARRDHRSVGKRLDLFSLQEDAGGGLVFWHPKGARVRKLIEDYWRDKHLEAGYELLNTPHIADFKLWQTSGHAEFYSEDMFKAIDVDDGDKYVIKPMNCPFHCLVYKNSMKSYRDLPIRWAELGTVYRYERSGAMHGLMRVRGFTQDDAHIFCVPEQLESEIVQVLELIQEVLGNFGFSQFEVSLSTRPVQSVGGDELWSVATTALSSALLKKGIQYDLDEGGGAFYGPKIDIKIKDAIGRKWQCSTIQCDFNLPSRFNLEYVSSDSIKRTPVMIHRAIFGSVERFFGILIESTVGDFPLWLAPVQLRLLAVTDDALQLCEEIKELGQRSYGLRIEIDKSGERLGKQIRNAEMSCIPLCGILGKKELECTNLVLSLRSRKGLALGTFPVEIIFSTILAVMKDAATRSAGEVTHSPQ